MLLFASSKLQHRQTIAAIQIHFQIICPGVTNGYKSSNLVAPYNNFVPSMLSFAYTNALSVLEMAKQLGDALSMVNNPLDEFSNVIRILFPSTFIDL